ncbi:hypothetical protein EON71_01315, partial [bacterium]
MGTRGLIVLIFNGKKVVLYNQFDSYFNGLGLTLLEELIILLQTFTFDELVYKLSNVKIVTNQIVPSEYDEKALKNYTDLKVNRSSLAPNWYQLTRKTQGSLIQAISSSYFFDVSDEYTDEPDVFIEYRYYIDFDKQNFKCNRSAEWQCDLTLESLKNFIETRFSETKENKSPETKENSYVLKTEA